MHHRHRHQRHHSACEERRFARGERGLESRRFGGGRSGLGRFFAHGDLRLVILQLIADKPRHGYEIIKAIEDRVGGAYSPSPGVIYPTLTLLEEVGYVTVDAAAEGGKKLHAITPEGVAFLEANQRTLDPILARMDEANQAYGGGPALPIVRAMENLKLALRLRLSQPLNPEQVAALAAALDAAATAIERS